MVQAFVFPECRSQRATFISPRPFATKKLQPLSLPSPMREALVVPAARPVAQSRNASSTRKAPNARANRQPSHRLVIKHQSTPPSCQTLTCWRMTRPRPTIKACLQVGAHSASNPTSELSPVAFSVDAYIRTCTTYEVGCKNKNNSRRNSGTSSSRTKKYAIKPPPDYPCRAPMPCIYTGGGSTANCPRGGPLAAWKLENAVSKQS